MLAEVVVMSSADTSEGTTGVPVENEILCAL